MIKKHYTNNYKSLDRFDQLWYEINYLHTDQRWRTCITWSLILTCVITSRSAHCEAKNGSLSTKEPSRVGDMGCVKTFDEKTERTE